MDFERIPSLQCLSGVKIALAVIYHPDVVTSLEQHCPLFHPARLRVVLLLIGDKISKLTLPKKCCEKIGNIALNMLRELVRWKELHEFDFSLSQMSITAPCWTALGTIDETKSARKFFHVPYLGIGRRFKLACQYCFFYDATSMWEAMSKEKIYGVDFHSNLACWIRVHSDGSRCLESFVSWIEPRITSCNIHEFHLILGKKTPAERMHIMRTAALNENVSADIKFFCFQQLDKDTQQEVLEKFPVAVIHCFFRWPFQRYFLDLKDQIWTCISPEDFRCTIRSFLIEMVNCSWKNFELVEIFQQLWHRSPAHFKDHAIQSSMSEPIQILNNCSGLKRWRFLNRLREAFQNYMRSFEKVEFNY
ncbi:hypothetical protein AVEN_192744-1 [Araneus ventricosus]|uniref:Uncharacterized protein n=1 Tax=Araneus ventricosus TaxID=182803 RepID=A0A4Y2KPY1_ARAVE|nr:hypothetical protein AVEN_192744-1 [Araneus ventricosus]